MGDDLAVVGSVNYYNECDPFSADWLRGLIDDGQIPPGTVDERSIEDVKPSDLNGFIQCHFFAGIGGWPLALRMAGWPDDRPVWTGSCPCQSFSAAGKRAGFADERHLWPAWQWLIHQCRPATIYGEQVASRDALAWLDLVFNDLEGEEYACRAADLCAASVGAPHIRQRLFWMANASGERLEGCAKRAVGEQRKASERSGGIGRVGDADRERRDRQHSRIFPRRSEQKTAEVGRSIQDNWPSPANSVWSAADWLHCRDEKWRPVESGTSPLVDGVPGRVGLLRGYGNAIVPQVAAMWIEVTQ